MQAVRSSWYFQQTTQLWLQRAHTWGHTWSQMHSCPSMQCVASVWNLCLPQLCALSSHPHTTADAPLPAVSSSGHLTCQKTLPFFQYSLFSLLYLLNLALYSVKWTVKHQGLQHAAEGMAIGWDSGCPESYQPSHHEHSPGQGSLHASAVPPWALAWGAEHHLLPLTSGMLRCPGR